MLPTMLRTIECGLILPKRVIVVDDAGDDPDLCKRICHEYSAEYSRIEVWNKEGIPRAGLQQGLDILKINPTKYVCFCGADEFWFPNKLLVEFNALEENEEIGAAYGNFINADKNFTALDSVITAQALKRFIRANEGYYVDPAFLLETCCVIDNSLVRTKAWKEIKDWKIRDDVHRNFMWDFWLNLSENYKIKFIDTPIQYYWHHGSNISSKWDYNSEEFKRPRKIVVDDAKRRRGIA
ncbi:glycosyltransferase [Sulfuricurvum sp.]|uniref:glycosyltransferase n=1 Tax=Sulfuricurvum sp. TaxID=2025608 RepID=UPI0035666E5F